MKKVFPIFILLLVLASCSAPEQLTVTSANKDEVISAYKFFYALPRTILKIRVVQKSTNYMPGQLAQYAQRFFNHAPESLLPKNEYSLEDVEIESFAVYDTSRVFVINNYRNLNISLTPKGFLCGVNTSKCSVPHPFVQKKELSNSEANNEIDNVLPFPLEFFQQNSDLAKAQFLAKEIYTIREDRHFLAVGESSDKLPDGNALNEMLTYLENLEKDYLKVFYGTEIVHYDTLYFYFDPQRKADEQQILFRFSPSLGVVSVRNINAYPVFIDLDLLFTPVQAIEEQAAIVRLKSEVNSGLYYCVPAVTKISIRDEEEVYLSREIPIAQLGTIANLPIDFLMNNQIIFHSDLGSIKYISPVSE